MRRVLVVSNNALCKTNANGLTLINQLREFTKEEIITFSIDSSIPDKGTGLAHFKLTDKEKLKNFFKKRNLGHIIKDSEIVDESKAPANVAKHKGIKESAFGLAIREIVWKCGKWDKANLDNYIDEYKPTSILFMCGRSIFMNDLVTELSKKYSIPLYIYTSEDEYFHKYPFYYFLKNILQRKLKKSYRKMINQTKTVICQHDKLNKLFKDEFNIDTVTIYPRPTIPYLAGNEINKDGPVVYIGNSQPNRISSLIDFARALYQVDSKKPFHIYSGDLTKKDMQKLSIEPNIVIKEPVKREQVKDVMANACLLVHVESFRKKDKVLIENSFSTKTVDTINSGIPFVVYAPAYIGSSDYLKTHNIAHTENINQLVDTIKKLLGSGLKETASKQHSLDSSYQKNISQIITL